MSTTPDRLLDIVKTFAETEPVYDSDYGYDNCIYCPYDNSRHAQDCPWRDAREALGLEVPGDNPEPPTVIESNYGVTIAKIWEPALERFLTIRTPFSMVKGEYDE